MELRDRLREIVEEYVDPGCEDECVARILSLPEIKEALRYRNVVLASRLPDLPPDRVGELVRGLANRVAD